MKQTLLWRDNCIPNAAPGFCAASERRKIVQINVSSPVKAESLTQTWWCRYRRICTPRERFLRDSHLLAEPWMWKTHPGRLGLTFLLPILSQSTPSAVPGERFSPGALSTSAGCRSWSALLDFCLHSNAVCWQLSPNQVLVKCRRKWVNLAPAVKPWKLWLSRQPS